MQIEVSLLSSTVEVVSLSTFTQFVFSCIIVAPVDVLFISITQFSAYLLYIMSCISGLFLYIITSI